MIVPLSEATTGLVDRAFLAAMPDGALLVNVARGKVVDTDALVEATATGRIMAALDVTDPEPLPDGHPLWRCPGVLVTPHVGGDTSAFTPRAVAPGPRAAHRARRRRAAAQRGQRGLTGSRDALLADSVAGVGAWGQTPAMAKHCGGGGDAQGAVAGAQRRPAATGSVEGPQFLMSEVPSLGVVPRRRRASGCSRGSGPSTGARR